MKDPNSLISKHTKDMDLFLEYHKQYPSHGYRWLNAKIRLDTGIIYTDNYAYQICKMAHIKSEAKKIKRRNKPNNETHKVYPNLLLNDLTVKRPFEVILSDMTQFKINGIYYELTLYMDLFNNEIITYDVSDKRGDRNTINGLKALIEKKKEYADLKCILHSDRGSVYSSKSFNELLPLYNITRSMSRAATPTDNGTMEAINGWLKEELFSDFKLKDRQDIKENIDEYIIYFNTQRPTYALGYKTPKQVKDEYLQMKKD